MNRKKTKEFKIPQDVISYGETFEIPKTEPFTYFDALRLNLAQDYMDFLWNDFIKRETDNCNTNLESQH